jgi:hypothetical protein
LAHDNLTIEKQQWKKRQSTKNAKERKRHTFQKFMITQLQSLLLTPLSLLPWTKDKLMELSGNDLPAERSTK